MRERHEVDTANPGTGSTRRVTPTDGSAADVWRHVPHARWHLVASVLLAAAASGASVALLGVSGWLLARAAEMPPIMYLNVAVVGVRFFGIARGFFRYLERLVSHDLALRLQSALRIRVYGHLSRTTLLGRRRGDLLSRIVADVEAIMDQTVRVVIPFASASAVALGAALLLMRFSPVYAVLLLTTTVIAGIVVPWLAARASAAADASVAPLRGDLAAATHEFSRAVRDLVASRAHMSRLARLDELDARVAAAEARAAWVRGVAVGVQLLAAGVAVAAAVWTGRQAIVDGMPSRMLAVLVLVPLALHEVLADLAKAAQTRTRTAAALGRVDEELAREAVGVGDRALSADAEPAAPLVVAEDLTIGWPGHPVVASGLSFRVGPGERLAVTGPSGVGKTTLAATLLGMIPPAAGQVEASGRVGYLAQDAHIFATTVAENVRIGRADATDDEVAEALRLAGLEGWPLERRIGEWGTSISGGEARRLALARLAVGRFDVWVLDEPTEHLDQPTAIRLMNDVWAVVGDAPAVVVTHDAGVRDQCSAVCRLDMHTADSTRQ